MVAELRDVTLRDGLQLTGKMLPAERKASIARQLLALGVPSLEIGSMARGDLVPPLANTAEVVALLTPDELAKCWVWVATPGHVKRAGELGVRNFQYCLSVSNTHNEANLGRSTERSLDTLPEALALAREFDGHVELCLATAFTCPFVGYIDPDEVIRIAKDPRTAGTIDIVVCDTLGQATPKQVDTLLRRVVGETPPRRLVFHGHDTWGMGVSNALAAIHAGATMIDGALGGLGGCPFAPGASGNTSSEDLLFATQPPWFTPDVFKELIQISQGLLLDVEEPNRSGALRGANATSETFPWGARRAVV